MPPAPSCDCDGALTALIVTDPTRPATHDFAATMTDGTAALAAQPAPAPDQTQTQSSRPERTSWWPRDLGPVLSGEQTEPPPSILTRTDGQPLWYAGKINGLIGESESGKTWVALLAVAQQLEAGERVLYLDFEDAAPGIVSRLKALGVSGDDIATGLDYADPAESLHHAASGDLGELLLGRTYSLIVVDGFNAAMTLLGLDLMSNTDVTKFFQLLMKPLAKTGSAVAYVDHIGKNATDDSKGGIGAQAKRAMTTGCVVKVKVGEPFGRGMTGRLHLIVDKDRAGHVRGSAANGRDAGTATLVSDRDSGSVDVVITAPDATSRTQRRDGRLSMLMESICTWLATGQQQTSKNAIRQGVSGKNEDVEAALASLVRGGYVHQAKVGSGFSHTLIKRFSVAEELASEPVDNPDLAPSPHFAPTSPRATLSNPSNDLAPSPHPYRWGEGESTDEPNENNPNNATTSPLAPKPYPELNCNGCGALKPSAVIEAFKGYCADCSRERGQ
jgi:hypothetical protein